MKKLTTFLTTVALFAASTSGAAISNTGADAEKFNEIISGRGIDCSSFRPSVNPTLYFETIGPKAIINNSSTQLSLQMKLVYYRCLPGSDGEITFSAVDPKTPYQYEFEQFDGSTTSIKVNEQRYRFSAMIGNDSRSSNLKKGLPARVETDGLLNLVRFDLPLEKLLSSAQKNLLKRGEEIDLSVRVISGLSTNYRIGSQVKEESGFSPGTTLHWKVKLTNGQKNLKAELIKLESSQL